MVLNGSITLSGIAQPVAGQGIAKINIYVSASGGEVMYLHGYVAVGVTTYLIQSVEVTTREAPHRFLTGPPAGALLTSDSGRIYMAIDNMLAWTDPLGYSLFNPMRNYAMLDSDIKVLQAVPQGLWIVTEFGGTFWLQGANPNEAQLLPKADYSAPLQSAVSIKDDNSIAWISYRGWVIGTKDGQLKNLSDDRIGVNQTGDRAITLYREKNSIKQLVGLVSGSTQPSINADDYDTALNPPSYLLYETGLQRLLESGDYLQRNA